MKFQFILIILLISLSACDVEVVELDPTPTEMTATKEKEPAPTPMTGLVDEFSKFLEQTILLKLSERQSSVNLFTAQIASLPLVQGDRALFIWRGDANSVQLVGDMNNWNLETAEPLIHIDGTDLWYLEGDYEHDARLDYLFIVDGGGMRMDPLNPNRQISSQGLNSVLLMPAYESRLDVPSTQDEIPRGRLSTHAIESDFLGETRTFVVYTPAGHLVGQQLPSIYFNDGTDYISLIDTPAILDQLISQRKIPPLVAVFVPPIDRNEEYDLNDSYIDFLADELVPFVKENYDTDKSPQNTAVLGVSMGGRSALYAALERPDVFGLVGSQSGVLSKEGDLLIATFEDANQELAIEGQIDTLFQPYLVVGSYETGIRVGTERIDLAAGHRRLVDILREAGYDLVYEEVPEGHSWGMWKNTLGSMLEVLFNQ